LSGTADRHSGKYARNRCGGARQLKDLSRVSYTADIVAFHAAIGSPCSDERPRSHPRHVVRSDIHLRCTMARFDLTPMDTWELATSLATRHMLHK